jgi:DNA repair photolyase
MIKKHYKPLKNIKKNTRLMDYYFMGKYSFSPYMACQHACKYCDGRAEKYYMEGDFEKDIIIRENLPDLLATKLPTYRERGSFLIGSGISDPYQPIEASQGIMKECLEQVIDTKFSVSVMTKSDLALRDLDLYDAINQKTRAILMVSLVYPDDQHRKIIEPYASSVESRLEMIRQFKARDIPVCVMAMPLLPKICDDMTSVTQLFDKLKALEVDVIMASGLTLRPGKQKELYFQMIKDHYPHLLEEYKKIYMGNYPSGNPENWYTSKTMPPIYQALKERSIPNFLPHKIYKGIYPAYDEVYFLIKHMKQLYKYSSTSIEPLKKADAHYKQWYLDHKSIFNRKRSMTEAELEAQLWNDLNNPASPILAYNQKLTSFIIKAVFGDFVFDYTSLKLIPH